MVNIYHNISFVCNHFPKTLQALICKRWTSQFEPPPKEFAVPLLEGLFLQQLEIIATRSHQTMEDLVSLQNGFKLAANWKKDLLQAWYEGQFQNQRVPPFPNCR